MPEALIGLILALGFHMLTLATLYPHNKTEFARDIDNLSRWPVIISCIWVFVEAAKVAVDLNATYPNGLFGN